MSVRRVLGGGLSFIIGLLLAVTPVVAGDDSDMAGRLVTWQKAYNSDDLDALQAMYTEDGCRMPPNAETVSGSEAMQEFNKRGKELGWAEVTLGLTSSATSGDWGWATGTYVILGADGSELDHGKWMNVSKKVDGKWLIHADIWNTNAPE